MAISQFIANVLPQQFSQQCFFQHVLKYVFSPRQWFVQHVSSSYGHFSHNNKFQNVIPNNNALSNMFVLYVLKRLLDINFSSTLFWNIILLHATPNTKPPKQILLTSDLRTLRAMLLLKVVPPPHIVSLPVVELATMQ